jgi:serine/threonine-protein kinase
VLGRGYAPQYLPTGHLLYVDANGTLFRVPFDLDRLRLDGQPVAVGDHVRRPGPGVVVLAASPTGDFAYRADTLLGTVQRRLVLVNRAGVMRPFPLPPNTYNSFRLSPDGRSLVLEVTAGTNDGGDLYVVDLGDSTPRLLSRKGVNNYPAWSPDGRRIGYGRLLDGERDLAWQAADGSDTARVLLRRPGEQFEMEFVPGTDRILVRDGNATGGARDLDILEFRLTGDSVAPFAAVRGALERAPRVSPDGRWVAYVSNETGRDQIFVRPYPDPGTGASWQVSEDGGLEPVWSRKGTELFYKAGESLMVASVRTTPTFSVQSRRALFAVPQFMNNPWHARYDVMPGDTTLLMIDTGRELDETNARTILVQHAAPR